MGNVVKVAAAVVLSNAERIVQVAKDSQVQKAATDLVKAVRKAW